MSSRIKQGHRCVGTATVPVNLWQQDAQGDRQLVVQTAQVAIWVDVGKLAQEKVRQALGNGDHCSALVGGAVVIKVEHVIGGGG